MEQNPREEKAFKGDEMSRKEIAVDIVCSVLGGAVFFVMIWVSFGLDVITTGM
jgi:hypothetical protein|tara:strand:+ start:2450 stop:2608 length:159 start_codon:yes stop_codon:yes gene_type:complete